MREKPYDREKAVEYAHKYALSRNPRYYDFTPVGGDCSNFVSQAVYAGSGVMNYKKTFGWYYKNANDRAPAWTAVNFLYNFLTGNKGVGPYAVECDISNVKPGDIVQISFDGKVFVHSAVIVAVGRTPDVDNILVAAHTYDVDNKPLSLYDYKALRFLCIQGVRY